MSMNYTIAIFPKFAGIDNINSIRKKYDPSYDWLKPHIALVYYFKEKPLTKKIHEITKEFSPFKIKLNKIRASSKHNLIFLDVTDGREEIIKIKNILYKKLGLRWDKNFSYAPHITIANLKTKKEQQNALKEIKNKPPSFLCEVNSFHVLEVSEDLKRVKSRKNLNSLKSGNSSIPYFLY